MKISVTRSRRMQAVIVAATIGMMGAFHLLTIRDGHNWGGDFSIYVHQAKNLVLGVPYDSTGYLFNPEYALYGPAVVPPVFPVLLSPVYAVFGLNLNAMKGEIVVLFVVFLCVMYLTFRNELRFPTLMALTVLVGLSPVFWSLKERVLSGTALMVFLFLTIYVIRQAYETRRHDWGSILWYGFLIGGCAYLAYGTRSIGIVIIPSLVVFDLIKSRRPTRLSLVATAVFALCVLVQKQSLPAAPNYADLFVLDVGAMASNVVRYAKTPAMLFEGGHPLLRNAIFFAVSLLALAGYLRRLRRRFTFIEVFLPAYLCTLIIWPYFQGLRYLLPILPLYLYYAFVGIEETPLFRRMGMRRAVFGIVVYAVLASYVGQYTRFDYGPHREGVGRPESVELFTYIRQHTQPGDVFLFRKPRVMALFGERTASVYPRPHADTERWAEQFWTWCETIGADYVVVATARQADGAVERREVQFFSDFVYRHLERFERVYRNTDFELYRIKESGSADERLIAGRID